MLGVLFMAFTIFFPFSDEAPLGFTLEMREDLLVYDQDAAKNTLGQMTPHQAQIFGHLYQKHLGRDGKLSRKGGFEIIDEMKTLYPGVYKSFMAFHNIESNKRSRLGLEANRFLSDYSDNENNMTTKDDNELANFVCIMLPKWRQLSVQAREDIRAVFPKIPNSLEDPNVLKIANCPSNELGFPN